MGVEREIEDLDALIAEAGGTSAVFGYSSGATLALKAAASGLAISKLALYEPPFLVDDSRPPLPADLPERLAELIARRPARRSGRALPDGGSGHPAGDDRADAPSPVPPRARSDRPHPRPRRDDHRGPHALDRADRPIATPTLVIDGENSVPLIRNGVGALADALPNGKHRTLAGQTHNISPEATALVLEEFLSS